MKKIAVITGASSGMGRRFAQTLSESGKNPDEVWVIARRKERLEELELGIPKKILALDLSKSEALDEYKEALDSEKPEIVLLVNACGFGKFKAVTDTPLEENLNMVDLNCKALMAMCQISISYMKNGASIINIASVAAYQPIPYINVYGATKSFVLNFSRALGRELKKDGISVTAVCPFWTRTEFFDRAIENDGNTIVKKYVAMYEPEDIVKRAWRDAKKKRDVSRYGFTARLQTDLAKILPHSFVMDYWMKQQKLK